MDTRTLWDEYVESELRSFVADAYPDDMGVADRIDKILDTLSSDDLFDRFHHYCSEISVHAEVDWTAVYYGLDDIGAAICADLEAESDPSPGGAQRRAIRDGLQGALSI